MKIDREAKLPVYKQIHTILVNEIASGLYEEKNLLPGEHALSNRFGVGRATVRKALQILDDEGYIRKIPGLGTKIIDQVNTIPDHGGAEPHLSSDAVVSGKNVLFITQTNYLSNNNEYFHYELIHAFERKISEKGYNLIIKSISEENDDFIKIINQTSPAGIIFDSHMNKNYYSEAIETGIPCISVNHYTPLITSVVNNNFDGAYNVMKMLTKAGHEKIAVITGKRDYQTSIERLSGVQRFYLQNGMKLEDKYIICGDWRFESGYSSGEYILSMDKAIRPSAVFAFNDDMAFGFYNFLEKSNIAVPDEISIVGFDKSNRYNSIFRQITTVDVNIEAIVSHACWYLWGIISGNAPDSRVKIQIETSIVTGDTVKSLV